MNQIEGMISSPKIFPKCIDEENISSNNFNNHNNHYFYFFCSFNISNTGRLSLEELKIMMEKLGAPQTHLGLKAMIKV